MPNPKLSNFLIHRELILENHVHPKPRLSIFVCRKANKGAVCPKCATLATAAYDSRKVCLKDEPVRGNAISLVVTKKRFYCKRCKKPFTEPLPGVCPNGERPSAIVNRFHGPLRILLISNAFGEHIDAPIAFCIAWFTSSLSSSEE
jgi:hypothetical protein